MSRERERLEPAVSAVRKLEAERDLWRERAGLLEGHRNRNAHLLAALADLSLILPLDSMVRLFNLEDGVLRIQGTSGQAAALPRILEDSRYFREVELASGITRDSKGRESYNIQAKLEDPLPPPGDSGPTRPPQPGSQPPPALLPENPAPAETPAPVETPPRRKPPRQWKTPPRRKPPRQWTPPPRPVTPPRPRAGRPRPKTRPPPPRARPRRHRRTLPRR